MSVFHVLSETEEARGRAIMRDLGIAFRWIESFDPPHDFKLVASTLQRGQKLAAELIDMAKRGMEKSINYRAKCDVLIAKAQQALRTGEGLEHSEAYLNEFDARMKPLYEFHQTFNPDAIAAVSAFQEAAKKWIPKR